MGHKRLFLALSLPNDVLAKLAKYRDEMGRETPYLRWAPLFNLHITALFLGDVREEDIGRVAEAGRSVCSATGPFSLICRGAFYAPRHAPPSMVWLVFDASSAFSLLTERLADAVQSYAPMADRNHMNGSTPHITLARFVKTHLKTRAPARSLRHLRRTGIESAAVSISFCALMESQMTRAGPLYRTMSEYMLTPRVEREL